MLARPGTPTGKWRLVGYDTFEGGRDGYYPIEGEYDSEEQAKRAAREQLEHLEKTQPSKSSGGQSGVQDQVFIERPDGSGYRFLQ